jgi:hypothetical protein
MNQQWIIEVVEGGGTAFITERRGELYLTRDRSEAMRYPSQLDAKCAKVYVPDRYQPCIIPLRENLAG